MTLLELYEGVWEGVREGAPPTLAAQRLAFLRRHLHRGERVLDVGCGEGWFTQALSEQGVAVVGADVAREPLRRAAARCGTLDLRLIDEQRGWPFADAEFDLIWAGEVIEHVADTASWLSELRRVLRPGGALLISTPAHDLLRRLALAVLPNAFEAHFDPRADHLRFYTRGSLRALLQDFRFEAIEIEGLSGVPGFRSHLLASASRARF
jgi:2-polyprenyl-6-hydroxyphenyl methylase / 3-demethylubiquinone-9 3-methyltransferase